MVLSVGEFWLPPPSSYGLMDTDFTDGPGVVMREAKDLAAAGREKVREAFPEWTVHAEVRGGGPARQLLDLDAEWKPDLIVLGSHGRTGLARFFLGSVSQKVAIEAIASVRVARGRVGEPGEPVRLVVAVDGSEGSNAAVRSAASRVWPKGSQAKLVTAIGPLAFFAGDIESELARVNALHAPLLELLRNAGLEASSSIQAAEPREFVLREAEHLGARCIFLGATGLIRLERFLFGSVVTAVTARAHCSVEVVRERL
jgi:nucleotide-binding universal stress UspA family protein